jgi:hypothetical protein
MTSESPARSTIERKTLARSEVNRAKSVGSYDACIRLASMREKSSNHESLRRQAIPVRDRDHLHRGGSMLGVASSSSNGASINVSGVLNSWLMLAKKRF